LIEEELPVSFGLETLEVLVGCLVVLFTQVFGLGGSLGLRLRFTLAAKRFVLLFRALLGVDDRSARQRTEQHRTADENPQQGHTSHRDTRFVLASFQ